MPSTTRVNRVWTEYVSAGKTIRSSQDSVQYLLLRRMIARLRDMEGIARLRDKEGQ